MELRRWRVCGEGWVGILCTFVMLEESTGFCPRVLPLLFPLVDPAAHCPKWLTSPCLSWFLYVSGTLNMLFFFFLSCNASLYPYFLLFILQILASLSSCKWKVKMQVIFFLSIIRGRELEPFCLLLFHFGVIFQPFEVTQFEDHFWNCKIILVGWI